MWVISVLAIFIVGLIFFTIYFNSSMQKMHDLTVQKQNEYMQKSSNTNNMSLIESQNKILGYKPAPIIRWSPNDPKPPKADIFLEESFDLNDFNVDAEIKCLDNECRWKEIN